MGIAGQVPERWEPAWRMRYCRISKCEDGVKLHGHRGFYSIYPVEYKKGNQNIQRRYLLQLTAQAMCLEEMFSTTVSEGNFLWRNQKTGSRCNYGRAEK